MKKIIYIISVACIFCACASVKVAVPEAFSQEATSMKVKGLNGWMFNQQLSFGTYVTSTVKRGWDFTGNSQFTRFSLKPEDIVLSAFNVYSDKASVKQRNRFQYTIQDARLVTEVFAQEKFSEKQIVYKTNLAWLDNLTKTQQWDYAFNATIVPLNFNKGEAWSLVMVNQYDGKAPVKEMGYVTNGKEKVEIKGLYLSKIVSRSGKEQKVLGGPILTGYELRWDDGVVGVIDLMDNQIWLANNLEASEKIILSAVSSAIMLKRMQDVQQDKDRLSDR
jgi:hypothetical protein